MSDDQFPYEYGSDLHWLWGWGERLRIYLSGHLPPRELDWMLFRPDHLARDAMTRLGARHAVAIGQIQDNLHSTELRCSEFKMLHPDEFAQVNFGLAMQDLQHRIEAVVETIAEAKSNKPAEHDCEVERCGRPIPSAKRTRPLGVAEAATYMGRDRKWLSRVMHDDKSMAWERKTRQSYIFCIDDFPPEIKAELRPRTKKRRS